MEGLNVRFTVVNSNGMKYFLGLKKEGCSISFSEFPPFFELVGSKISIKTSKFFGDKPLSCSIVARELSKISRDPIVRSCFNERIAGTFWSHPIIEATSFDEGDSLCIVVSEKSGITTHEAFRKFLLLRHYAMTEAPFMRKHRAFIKKMKEMKKKNFTEKDVLEHFEFPDVLYFPW